MFQTASGTIKKIVGKNEKPVNIQPKTVAKFKAANKMTGTVTTYARNQISNAVQLGFNLGKQASEELITTNKGQNINKNKYFIRGRNVGAGVMDLALGIIGGLENAFTSVAQGTKGMTESVLEHKYGNDVKQVFSETTTAAWDIYQMKGALKAEVLKQTGREIQTHLGSDPKPGSLNSQQSTAYPSNSNSIANSEHLQQKVSKAFPQSNSGFIPPQPQSNQWGR